MVWQTCFTCTSPVPLLTSVHFGFQNERKSSNGYTLFPIWALSHEINSHTLYTMLQQNITVQNSTQNHTIFSAHGPDSIFSFSAASHTPPPPQLLHWPACINACMLHMGLFVRAHVRVCVCVCVRVCEYVLGNKWMDNFILCISMLSVFLLLYTPWAVKLVLIGMVLTNFHYYYVSLYNTDMKRKWRKEKELNK